MADSPTYRIVRYFDKGDEPRREVIARGVSLQEAQAHCRDPETHSGTARSAKALMYTRRHGPWFDSFETEPWETIRSRDDAP